MTEFERRVADMLADRAGQAPEPESLADAARSRHRRWRSMRLAVVVAAVVALGVGGSLATSALIGGDEPPQADRDGPRAQPGEVPRGWRWESYRDVEFAVPPRWSHGSLDDWCADDGEPDTPRVERPGGAVNTILCPSSGYGARLGPAPANPPAGAVVRSRQVGGVTLSVVAPRAEVAETVAASLRRISGTDAHGCAPQKAVPPLGQMPPGESDVARDEQLSLCRYELGVAGPNLVDSERLTRTDTAALWDAVDAARPGSGPDSGPSTCVEWSEGQALLVRSPGQDVAWVHYDGCAGHGIDLQGRTFELSPQVMYWAHPRGGFAVDGSVPLPERLREPPGRRSNGSPADR